MVIQSPAAISYRIFKMSSGHYIILGKGIRPDKSRRFTLSRKRADPVKVKILGTAIRMILHILPDAVCNPFQLILDLVGIKDRIEFRS